MVSRTLRIQDAMPTVSQVGMLTLLQCVHYLFVSQRHGRFFVHLPVFYAVVISPHHSRHDN